MSHSSNLYYAIGTMSGTSMDGIDVALIQTDGEHVIQLLAQYSLSYPIAFHHQLKALEFAIRKTAKQIATFTAETLLEETNKFFSAYSKEYFEQYHQAESIPSMNDIIAHSTELHRQAIMELLKKVNLPADASWVVGYHGQTLYHQPSQKLTLQVGFPQQLADQLHMPVVANFRQNDIAHGGQGAPFAPLLHRALVLRDHLLLPVAIMNCGGISNVTMISGRRLDDVIGFDAGPGNVLLDQFVRERTQLKETMDRDGRYALRGKINHNLLKKLITSACRQENFYQKPFPKSLDTNDFQLIDELKNCSIEEGCATLAALTAETMILGIKQLPAQPKTIVLAGGGWHHPVISQQFIKHWSLNTSIKTADELGWSSTALEAQIFAYLAVRSLLNKPLTLPTTTGVEKPLSGGEYYQPVVASH